MERAVRGFSLVETLLAAFLGSLLLGVLVMTIIPLMRSAHQTSTRAALLQGVALATERLGGDLQRAPLTGITLPDAGHPGLVSIHGVASVTDQGLAVYDNTIILYEWDATSKSLTRAEARPPSITAAPLRLGYGQIRDFLDDQRTPRRRLVAGMLKEFSLQVSDGDDRLPLRLRVLAELEPEKLELKREFTLRTGGEL